MLCSVHSKSDIYIYIYVCVCVCVCVCARIYIYMCVYIYIYIVRWYRWATSEYLDSKNIHGIRFIFIGHITMLAVWLCVIDYILMFCLTEQITLWTLYDTTGWLLSKHSNPAHRFQIQSHPENYVSSETLEVPSIIGHNSSWTTNKSHFTELSLLMLS